MGTWGSGNFENDAELDFINKQVDHYVGLIEAIFGDTERFRLDEDAESMLMPCIELLLLVCTHCHGVLPKALSVSTWKVRYLAMYDKQIDRLEPRSDFKRQRRSIINDTFDKLLQLHEEQWKRDKE